MINVKRSLILLAALSVIVLMANICFSFWTMRESTRQISDLGTRVVPEVRSITLLDMAHDGIKGVTYQSIVESIKPNQTEQKKSEMLSELNDFNVMYQEQMKRLQNVMTQQEASTIKGVFDAYIQSSRSIVENSDGNPLLAKLVQFEENFSILERELDLVGDRLETQALADVSESLKKAQNGQTLLALLSLVSFLISVVSSIWIGVRISKFLKKQIFHLSEQTQRVNASVEFIDQNVESFSACTQKKDESVSQMNHVITDLVKQSQRTNGKSNSLNTEAIKTCEAAVYSQKTLADLVNEVGRIHSLQDAMKKTSDRFSEDIVEKLKLINEAQNDFKNLDEIVSRSKILAINAAMEASRAGEAGKGFAIVAKEMSDLARRSEEISFAVRQKISQTIESSLSSVESSTQNLAQVINESFHIVESTNEKSQVIVSTMTQVVATVDAVKRISDDLMTESLTQISDCNAINDASKRLDLVISELERIANSNQQVSHQLTETSGSLQLTSQKLYAMV